MAAKPHHHSPPPPDDDGQQRNKIDLGEKNEYYKTDGIGFEMEFRKKGSKEKVILLVSQSVI